MVNGDRQGLARGGVLTMRRVQLNKRLWLSTTNAAKYLGRSRCWLLARIKSGTFSVGVHYRNTSDGVRPTYEFCLEEIEKLYG